MATSHSIKLIFISFLAVGSFTLGACSSTPTKVNSGAIHAQTFSFVSRMSKPDANIADNREVVHRMIQNAITKNLAARGVNRVDTGGDVTVTYLIIKGNNVSTESISDYFGYSDDRSALHDKAHDVYTGSRNPNHFEAGTLVIDIIGGKDFKLLQRGYTTRPINPGLSSEARAARIQEGVDEILRDVRIAK